MALPISNNNGQWLNYLNALFTATSCICVTGLSVVDIALQFNLFGQIIILLLIQIGGLGIMTVTTLIFLLIKKRITLKDRLTMQHAVGDIPHKSIVSTIHNIIVISLIAEAVGTLLLLPVFIKQFGIAGIFKSIFLAVSAFCNAGIDNIGLTEYSGLTEYYNSVLTLLTLSLLVIIGGLGFTVIMEVFSLRSKKRLSLHSKIVLWSTLALIVFGFLFFLTVEWNNPYTLGKMNIGSKFLNAFFMSISPRTAGFNSINYEQARLPTQFVTLMLMFIGASPASTGGGIKTTTIIVMALIVLSSFNNRKNIVILRKKLNNMLTARAVAIVGLMALLTVLSTCALMITEMNNQALINSDKYNLLSILYEVSSSLATVGISFGVTPLLSIGGKIVIILSMIMGRLGAVTVGLLILKRGTPQTNIDYPEANILVG